MSRFKSYMHSGMRQVMARGPSNWTDVYVVNEFPKSGGTWLSQMLGELLGVPFPRKSVPLPQPSIIHGHFLAPWGIGKAVVIWRDGRDVMVSWYHHCCFVNDLGGNARLVERVRSEICFDDYHDVRRNLPHFIEYSFEKAHYPRFTWTDFVHRWHRRSGVVFTSYERLRVDTHGELARVARLLSGREIDDQSVQRAVDEFSFQKQSGRKPGEANSGSFLRKGIVGDWKGSFNRDARAVFWRYAGWELEMLGYETDSQWIDADPEEVA